MYHGIKNYFYLKKEISAACGGDKGDEVSKGEKRSLSPLVVLREFSSRRTKLLQDKKLGRLRSSFLLALLCLGLVSCANKPPAPIVEGWHQAAARHSAYKVQPGDTLYSVAWAFDMDFRDLAKLNHLSPPYHLQAGQHLRMGSGAQTALVNFKTHIIKPIIAVHPNRTITASIPAQPPVSAPSEPRKAVGKWTWPTQGKVVKNFSLDSGGTKGIEIAGRLGQPVVASAFGKVVYSGSGLRGYGNLIIIKHNDTFLSAYAFNQKLLVKENITVKAGQTIALMGRNNAGQVMLHFEIRRNGKPVNPLVFLRSSNNVLKE